MSTLASSAWSRSSAWARLLPVGAPLGDHRLDLRVLARVQRREREVLELPLHRVDPEAVRERRVHLEGLARLAHLLLLAQVLDRPHVVEAVGELDQDDALVLRHRDDHLAVVLGLRVLAALEVVRVSLVTPSTSWRDLVAELGADVLDRRLRVLDDVVEQRGGDRLARRLEPGEDLRDRRRVIDEVLAAAALLALVGRRGEDERAGDEVAVDVRVVRLDPRAARRRGPVMPLDVNHRHAFSVPRWSSPEQPRQECAFDRERRRPMSVSGS